MMYMKKFPEKREPFFWNIIACELAGTDKSCSDMDRKVMRPLAYGFLSRAAADVEKENQSVSFSNFPYWDVALRILRGSPMAAEGSRLWKSFYCS
jgi:hypothetical protein